MHRSHLNICVLSHTCMCLQKGSWMVQFWRLCGRNQSRKAFSDTRNACRVAFTLRCSMWFQLPHSTPTSWMYIMDVGKDLNKETGIFAVNSDGYCVNVCSLAPYTVCASFSFMWLCLITLHYVHLLVQIFCGVQYHRSLRPLVTVTCESCLTENNFKLITWLCCSG
jgi:hypothetical protein